MKSAPAPEAPRELSRRLLDWYRDAHRDLPWRRARDPYAIWVSEVMLQQTQVATVVDYFNRWMRRFPDVHALAAADEADVLHAWQGLGYYSRARNLWRGAKAVVQDHGGELPRCIGDLRALPGIGPYSAGAIASIAFGERTPIVDGNVVRVLCRVFALRGDPARAPLKRQLWALAESLVPAENPSHFNQALMELGATVCTPRAPLCATCPVSAVCRAHAQGAALRFPELAKRRATVAETRVAAVVSRRGRVLVVQAPADARRWAGMWLFPNVELASGEAATAAVARAAQEAAKIAGVIVKERLCTIQHAVTHHRITLDAYRCEAREAKGLRSSDGVAWRRVDELEALAMPSAHRRIARVLLDGV